MKNKPYPLYDIPKASTLNEVIKYCTDKYTSDDAFRIPVRRGEDEYISYTRFGELIDGLGAYFNLEGLIKQRVAILGENCFNWVITYFALTNSGNTVVPLDRELSKEELLKLIERCGCKAIVCSSVYSDFEEYFKENCKCIEKYYLLDDTRGFAEKTLENCKEIDGINKENYPSPDDLAAIVFTSGTTGKSKGVMLTHRNIASDAMSVCRNACGAGRGLLILPLHHTFSITANILCATIYGGCIYAITSLRTVQKDMQKNKTTVAIVVPAVVEVMHKKIIEAVKKEGKYEKMQFGMKLSNFLLKLGIDVRRKLFKEVFDAFGGEINTIICGGSALAESIENDFVAWGFNVIQGYGISECSPIVCVNRNEHQKRKSCGLALDCNEVKIDNPDKDGIGEILVKGENVFIGYLDDEEENAKSFTPDGWFRTGDIGYIDSDGFLFITGRIKNLIILSNGKNVSPEELEEKLAESIESIEEVIVYEENEHLIAEIFLNEEEFPNARDTIREQINELNRNLPPYKKIFDFKLRDTEFEKTTTMKIKRKR